MPEIQLQFLTRNTSDLPVLTAINEEAFPEWERASIEGMFDSGWDGRLDMIGIYEDHELTGFFAVRRLGKIRYLAFFAVGAQKRSRGIGSRALQLLMRLYPDGRMVAELEAPDEQAPNNDIRRRRRDFYLRNGFHETGWFNFYDETEFEIVCSDTEFDPEEFGRFIDYLNSVIPIDMPMPYQKK